ncbi:adenylate/guanylate cyclase domain-containing protein [Mycobacterium sp. 1274761.0]|uniref:ATP-binding protein n=1 Tax=Mycobacterium sp. 1274761.0 TaxID=1834077 RepID=UPI0007FE73DA|nr:adenylate/guanylate cyclase domain-containing protein [Mycobacterium sp. 1274761.0]OBK74076.1 cyclase [Mycobacterium sp. 1274761.0]
MTADPACRSCGAAPRAEARFCDACGAPLAPVLVQAEYKQVTVLFADVVHSMDIAAAVGPERLREIMADLFDRSGAVVTRYGGTVDKFTGDGIMAVFGAPRTLEDHAFRACITALEVQRQAAALAAEVLDRDGIALQLRIGLNSGQVIAGEIGSRDVRYTAFGEQVGMAQRMESVAPPGGVMLSDSTARLVENAVALGDNEIHHVKGAASPVTARRLLAIDNEQPRIGSQSVLVGRVRELNFLTGVLDEAIAGAGCVVNIIGPPGIGKSRLARETAALAASRGAAVITAHCESHTTDVAFRTISSLFRASMGLDQLDDAAARAQIRMRFADADAEDLLLLEDLLGVADTDTAPTDVAADARRRRLAALINAAALAQTEPAVYVIEDVHWIDETSESMLAQMMSVIPHTPTLVLITCRPEYQGVLTRVSGAQTIGLRPLSDVQSSTLVTELLGTHSSLAGVAGQVCARAAGNPFFAEEIVRDLAERGVLEGTPGAYVLRGDRAELDVPATLQATIGARIDRLSAAAKHTLSAAAVIGSRFDARLLADVVEAAEVAPLIAAELVEQVQFGRRDGYAFRHPLIRTVAYESQLKSDRAQLHRRLATVIEAHDAAAADENAALIAEHLEAAGELHAAFGWHLRAGTWLANRDFAAARNSWRRAQQIADRLSDTDPQRASMRIAPRALLCGSAHRLGGGVETGFDELRELCMATGDLRSLAIGYNGHMTVKLFEGRRREASELADEMIQLLESIGDPALMAALSLAPSTIKCETREMREVLRLTQRVISLAEDAAGESALFIGSPVALALALRGQARACLGLAGWKEDMRRAPAIAQNSNPLTRQAVAFYTYGFAIPYGVLLPDDEAQRETAETLVIAEHIADNPTFFVARLARAMILAQGPDREAGVQLLTAMCGEGGIDAVLTMPIAETHVAQERARTGDFDDAIALSASALKRLTESGESTWSALASMTLAEALIQRGDTGDLERAQSVMDQLAAIPTDPGFVLHDITLHRLRTVMARARGDDAGYRESRDCYRSMAERLGFEGHMAWAAEL